MTSAETRPCECGPGTAAIFLDGQNYCVVCDRPKPHPTPAPPATTTPGEALLKANDGWAERFIGKWPIPATDAEVIQATSAALSSPPSGEIGAQIDAYGRAVAALRTAAERWAKTYTDWPDSREAPADAEKRQGEAIRALLDAVAALASPDPERRQTNDK